MTTGFSALNFLLFVLCWLLSLLFVLFNSLLFSFRFFVVCCGDGDSSFVVGGGGGGRRHCD